MLGSTVDTCTASVYEAFWKNFTLSLVFSFYDFMLVSVFSAELGSIADTCTASVYIGLGFSRSFSVKVDSDP